MAIKAGLSIFRQSEFLLGSLEHETGEIHAQSLVHFLEHVSGSGKGVCEFPAHSYLLRTLSRKNECARH